MGVGRRHDFVLVIGDEALPEFARVGIGGGDDLQTVAVAFGFIFFVESEDGLAMARIGTVAMETTVREDGEDFAAEADLFPGTRRGAANDNGEHRDERGVGSVRDSDQHHQRCHENALRSCSTLR
jgi:hypothetical protein